MFRYTVIKDLCGGQIIKGTVSGEIFLFFQECEDIIIPLTLGEDSLSQENLGKTFEILVSEEFDRKEKGLEQKRVFVLKWKTKLLIFVYQDSFIPEYGGIDRSDLENAFLIC